MSVAIAIERWIVCATGWHQEGRLSGIDKIQNELHIKSFQQGYENTRVLLVSWKDSMKHLAQRMWEHRPVDHQPRIVLIGYSYGGYTINQLAKILTKMGWRVELEFLIDAVWRWLSKLPSFLSLLGGWMITAPDEVDDLYWWHQKMNKPMGHDVRWKHKHSLRWHEQELPIMHDRIDDDPDIKKRILQLVFPEGKAA